MLVQDPTRAGHEWGFHNHLLEQVITSDSPHARSYNAKIEGLGWFMVLWVSSTGCLSRTSAELCFVSV